MSSTNTSSFRTDIQGLRAIAVLLVLVFHIWPSMLTGGYVGVDVFFVISGYLITGLLVREAERGRISLLGFYARRIRRLLPAASLTLVAAAIGGYLWLPPAVWSDLAKEVLASGLYVENLLLVQNSVDYLALGEAPSPVQHYWSLSVEEQFYIVWPLLMIVTGALATRLQWRLRGTFAVALATVTLASLGWGIYMSFTDPAPGYFLTTTRIWELGVGGLLALVGSGSGERHPTLRNTVGWAGCAAILVSAIFYTNTLPFPGYEALLPTLGAAAVIYAGSGPTSVLGRVLGNRVMQYFGDISYSLYLWHWPVVVFYPYVTGRDLTLFSDAVTAITISVVLAHASKYLIEDRFRHAPARARGEGFPSAYAMGGACMVVVVAAAALPYVRADSIDNDAASTVAQAAPDYPGAQAFLYGAAVKPVAVPQPAPGVAKLDRGPAYGGKGGTRCIAEVKGTDLVSCHYGTTGGKFRVVLVGDSHAAHWLPAFEQLAIARDWDVTALTKSGCAFADLTVQYGSPGTPPTDYVECDQWKWKALDRILAEKPDLVVISESPNHRTGGMSASQSQQAVAAGVVTMAKKLTTAGIKVSAIKHTPWLALNAPACMSKPGASPEACSGVRHKALRNAALNIAASLDPQIKLLNFDDAFCRGETCPVVIGNVFVYRDQHHMTATFSRTLSRALHERIQAAYPGTP
ncbi:acyltransferase family protein [Montanilutibacter psychrotolerans]|uniref:Acyltransferase n=1 Tax=Montanilutibacter psychrotolerans TaxID=1327343 RepID=A0A3M8SYM1_9GAMM|nr:acyltransferase family protein [Lysobacter psychrotolerans]RNF84354.1 acyltransferase [Lysobacter psychrotolerans]